MDRKSLILALVVTTVVLSVSGGSGSLLSRICADAASTAGPEAVHPPIDLTTDDPSPPAEPVKLIFIHHSTGGNWLADETVDQPSGGLGQELMNNNYFVSATNYGWGPYSIGDRTDIPDWPEWFTGSNRDEIMSAVYAETGQNVGGFGNWTRMADPDPGGENEIVMFKSCFPNSDLHGNPDDPPLDEPNDQYTVENAKAVYNDILTYFATRQDKLFVVITAPPLMESATAPERAANARAFNNWLLNDWLDGYAHDNVAVFDYYNVLTSNGGDANTNDYDARPVGNHHYWNGSEITHTQTVANDYSAYPSGDSHPTSAGHRKATAEFVPLLNVYYNRWKSGDICEAISDVSITGPTSGYTNTLYEFTADVTPTDASTPITYTWSPSPDAGANAVVSYTWASTGTKTITVTAENCGGSDTDFHTITIKVKGEYLIYLPLILKAFTSTPTPSPSDDLIQPSDLTYQGAFRLPDSPGTPDNVGWEWSNWASAATYYPDGDPLGPADGYPGSVFGVGHDHTQYVSEVGIPVPVDSPGKDVSELNAAETLQAFHDVRGDLFDAMELPRVGLAYLPAQGAQSSGKLYFAWAPHLDEGATNPSHGWCELDLASPQTAGAWRIGDYWNYVTGDYILEIPQAWADANTPGMYLATGRFRDGGQGAEGPALFAIGPWNEGNPPAPGSTLAATPLLLYESVYESNPTSLTDYHHSDEWTGGAWLTAGDKAAVVFVGTKGQGDCWYGCADGTTEPPWPDDCDRGWWSTNFVAQMLFYDPAELAAVAQGTVETYEPQPYATVDVDEYLYHIESDQQKYHLGAAAFDRERGLLYVFEPFGDGDKPLVHVWRVES